MATFVVPGSTIKLTVEDTAKTDDENSKPNERYVVVKVSDLMTLNEELQKEVARKLAGLLKVINKTFGSQIARHLLKEDTEKQRISNILREAVCFVIV